MKRTGSGRKWTCRILLPVLFAFFAGQAMAADLQGAKDHPLLKRFGGSEIVGYDVKRFVQYDLQTSTFVKYDTDTKQRLFASVPLQLEGSLTRIWYEAPGETSALELIRNYENELTAKSFEILYASYKDAAAVKWTNFLAPFGDIDINSSRRNYIFRAADDKGAKVLSASLERPEGNVYVYLTAVDWAKDDATYQAKRGAYIAVDIVEVQPMTQNMVTVTSDEMAKAIAVSGRVALYGIYFDSGKAEIKPESKAALEEISKLLKADAALNLYVVGHTDNVGVYEANLALSQKRSEAVTAALTSQYGIAAVRLTAKGVANLAPTAVNTTEEGRAKNRRVELVPR